MQERKRKIITPRKHGQMVTLICSTRKSPQMNTASGEISHERAFSVAHLPPERGTEAFCISFTLDGVLYPGTSQPCTRCETLLEAGARGAAARVTVLEATAAAARSAMLSFL